MWLCSATPWNFSPERRRRTAGELSSKESIDKEKVNQRANLAGRRWFTVGMPGNIVSPGLPHKNGTHHTVGMSRTICRSCRGRGRGDAGWLAVQVDRAEPGDAACTPMAPLSHIGGTVRMMSPWTGQGRFPASLSHEHAGMIARLVAAVLAARVADPSDEGRRDAAFPGAGLPGADWRGRAALAGDGFRP